MAMPWSTIPTFLGVPPLTPPPPPDFFVPGPNPPWSVPNFGGVYGAETQPILPGTAPPRPPRGPMQTLLDIATAFGTVPEWLRAPRPSPPSPPRAPFFPQSPESTGFQNLLAGLGSAVADVPYDIAAFGKRNISEPITRDVVPFFTTPVKDLPSKEPVGPPISAQPPPAWPTPGPVPPTFGLGTRTQIAGGPRELSIPMGATPDYVDRVLGAEGTEKAKKSTAMGYGGFTIPTLRRFIGAVHPEFVKEDPDKIRMDKGLMREATAWYGNQNAKVLAGANVPVDNITLYGAHFLGPGDLVKVWNAPPGTPVSQIVQKESIIANPELLSGKTVDEVKAMLARKMQVLPAPPALPYEPTKPGEPATIPQPGAPAPPQMGLPKGPDFAKYQEWLEKMAPTQSQHYANILGGLAAGAAEIDPTKSGSFTRALAAAGAGGARGLGLSHEAGQRYAGTRAQAELGMAQARSQHERDLLNVTYQNAQSLYQVNVANQLTEFQNQQRERERLIKNEQTQYENELKKRGVDTANIKAKYEHELAERKALEPTVQHNANGLIISRLNPSTNQTEVQFIPLKDQFDQMEKVKQLVEAMGGGGPVAENLAITALVQGGGANPQATHSAVKRLAVVSTLKAGAGSSVFGKAYDAAMKQADTELRTQNPLLSTKPAEYQNELINRAAAFLMNHPAINDPSWLKKAIPFSQAARVLSGSEQSRE